MSEINESLPSIVLRANRIAAKRWLERALYYSDWPKGVFKHSAFAANEGMMRKAPPPDWVLLLHTLGVWKWLPSIQLRVLVNTPDIQDILFASYRLGGATSVTGFIAHIVAHQQEDTCDPNNIPE